MPVPFLMGWVGYNLTLPVHTKNSFRVISVDIIGALDSYFIHRYIIIKYRSNSIKDKIHRSLSELWPLNSVRKWFLGDTFSRYIIIKYRSSPIKDKIHQL